MAAGSVPTSFDESRAIEEINDALRSVLEILEQLQLPGEAADQAADHVRQVC